MTTRTYRRPSYRIVLDFDPVTWDALKEHARGYMERAAYKLIQDGLGVTTNVTESPPPKFEAIETRPPSFRPRRC